MASNYPGAIDSLPRPGITSSMNDSGYEGDTIIDILADSIEATQTELGVHPAGAHTTVVDRLNTAARVANAVTWRTGRYINNSITGTSTQLASTVALSTNYVTMFPIIMPASVTVDRVAFNVYTLTPATTRVGAYATDLTTGLPSGAPIADFGTVSLGTTGVKELTVSWDVSAGTMYWVGICMESNATSPKFYSFPITSYRGVGHTSGPSAQSDIPVALSYVSGGSALPSIVTETSLIAVSGLCALWFRRT